MTGYLADTSVFIATEQRRPLGHAPEGEARISVATLTELGVGVRRATTPPIELPTREARSISKRSMNAKSQRENPAKE